MARFNTLVGFAALAAFGYGIYIAAGAFVDAISSANPNIAAAIIAASGTVIAGLFAVILGNIYSKSREAAAAHRQRKIEVYDKFMRVFFEIMRKSKKEQSINTEELENTMFEFLRDITLWSSPGVIKSFTEFRNYSRNPSGVNIIPIADKFLRSIRKDIGLSNGGLDKNDLVRMIIFDYEEFSKRATREKT